jgi:trigger factor
LAPPTVADLKIEDGQPMTFRAVFETLPLVELPDYHGLPVKVLAAKVSDEALNQELERLREGAARYEPVDGRPLAQGDFALLDLTWRPAGGGKPQRDENALIEVGGEGSHPLLNQAMLGMAVGERKQVRIDYPADHPASRLAGKSFDYTLVAKGVKRKVVPALDDELAKDLGEFETLAALREDLRRHLEAAEQRRVQRDVRSGLLAALAQRASFEVPEALIERHMTARAEGAARSLAVQGLDPGRLGVDWRQYREAQREESVQAAKADILLAEIARRERIEVSQADLDAEVARLAERAKSSPEAMRARLEKGGDLDALRARIHEDKTLDLLKADARLEFE